LFLFKNNAVIDSIADQLTTSINTLGNISNNAKKFIQILQNGKSMRDGNVGTNIGEGNYWNVEINQDTVGTVVESILDDNHFGRNGIAFTQDSNIREDAQVDFTYKWKHYAPTDQRIDPSVTNIIDTVLLTNAYYDSVSVWKADRKSLIEFPSEPTTEELRVQFGELNRYKSVSDELIFNSGKFKILFGPQAEQELQATFKAVKIPTSNISDNELKTRIIQAIDEFFEINNWDFGERFFYTELAAYIHTQLTKFLSSVVIVPQKEESQFGNLFEILANPDELFLSTATVENVEIVKNYTETNLRA